MLLDFRNDSQCPRSVCLLMYSHNWYLKVPLFLLLTQPKRVCKLQQRRNICCQQDTRWGQYPVFCQERKSVTCRSVQVYLTLCSCTKQRPWNIAADDVRDSIKTVCTFETWLSFVIRLDLPAAARHVFINGAGFLALWSFSQQQWYSKRMWFWIP